MNQSSKWPNKILMVYPKGFTVAYSINPYMKDQDGNLNQVDPLLAVSQWEDLKALFEKLGSEVSVIQGQEGLPDMVFSANQTFPFREESGKGCLLLSQMKSNYRQPEVSYFKKWAQENALSIYELSGSSSFEGMGDALWDYDKGEIYGGFGPRTDVAVYLEIEKITKAKVHRLKLVNENFYHLDTCLCLLGNSTAFAVREAFDQEGWQILKNQFSTLIEIPEEEALKNFAGNMLCLNSKDVVLQSGSSETRQNLESCGFNVYEVETTEFMKAGGSVFCMKQLYF